jgi:Stage II sporulation protein E (SpoIIE)/PAS fold
VAEQSERGDVDECVAPAPDTQSLLGLATFTVDLAGRVVSWSLSAEELFGHPAEEIRGQDLCERLELDSQDGTRLKEALAGAATGQVCTVLLNPRRSGGRPQSFAFRWELLDEAGSQTRVMVIAQRPVSDRWANLPGDAGTRIGTTLDLGQTAREAVEVAVPDFADAAGVYVLERLLVADEFPRRPTAGSVVARRLAAHLSDQAPAEWSTTLPVGEVLVFQEESHVARCVHTSAPVLFDQVDEASLEHLRDRGRNVAAVSRYTSFLAVPLPARETVVGFAVFARAAGNSAFGPQDVAVATGLGSRAAVCIDNARLFSREQRTAVSLQRNMLPRHTVVPEGLDVVHRSLPAGATLVGGDWYDIVSLPGGRAALVVGDAMGHGPEAAAVMVQLRTAAHTLADLGLPPQEVLWRLDRIAQRLDEAPFGTCIYAVLDPASRTCTVARAGHLPPVLVQPDGSTLIPDLVPGLPLGMGETCYPTVELSLPEGATLALFTDGLVESRTRSLDDGISLLRTALATSCGEPLAPACERVTEALQQNGEDDLTLVLARIR